MSLYLDFNGAPTNASDLVWLAVKECGCATGSVCVAIGSRPIAITEAQARREMNDTARAAKADKRRYELALRSTVVERLALCECTATREVTP